MAAVFVLSSAAEVTSTHGVPVTQGFLGWPKARVYWLNLKRKEFVVCIPNYLQFDDALQLSRELRRHCEKDLVKHGGRRHALYFDINRSDPSMSSESRKKKSFYTYGGRDWPMQEGGMPDCVDRLLQRDLSNPDVLGLKFNGLVMNVYTSKHSYIWWHTDGQPGIADVVCTLTLRRSANLQFRERIMRNCTEVSSGDSSHHRDNEHFICEVPCQHGTLLVMGPGVQRHWEHRVNVPSESELQTSLDMFGSIERNNLTFHYHFDNDQERCEDWDSHPVSNVIDASVFRSYLDALES